MDIEQMKKELAELRAYKEAAEKQDPVAWGAFCFGGKLNGRLYSHAHAEEQIESYINTVHKSDDSITLRKGRLYAKPVPADKPAVVVPNRRYTTSEDGWHVAFNDGWNACRDAMLATAPSHSQQSAFAISESWIGTPAEVSQLPEPVRQYIRRLETGNGRLNCSKEMAFKIVQSFVNCRAISQYKNCLIGFDKWIEVEGQELLDGLNADRCPSQQSEQGGEA